jgi:hypothetical protein
VEVITTTVIIHVSISARLASIVALNLGELHELMVIWQIENLTHTPTSKVNHGIVVVTGYTSIIYTAFVNDNGGIVSKHTFCESPATISISSLRLPTTLTDGCVFHDGIGF